MRILHISDIQAGEFNIKEDFKQKYPKEWEKRYKSILDDIKSEFKIIHSQKPIDIIVISGDLASKGKEEDYIELEKDFLPIMEDVFLKGKNFIPTNRWLIAPGNHDVSYGKNDKKFNGYINFCKKNKFHLNFELNNPKSIFDIITFSDKKSGKQIDFILCNSCLEIDNGKEKNAKLSKDYFCSFQDKLDHKSYKIMVCHHRLIEISNDKKDNCLEDLHKYNVGLAFVGDSHESEPPYNKINGITFITAGSLMAKKSEREVGIDEINREFNVYDINLDNGELIWFPYLKSGEKWKTLQRKKIHLKLETKSEKVKNRNVKPKIDQNKSHYASEFYVSLKKFFILMKQVDKSSKDKFYKYNVNYFYIKYELIDNVLIKYLTSEELKNKIIELKNKLKIFYQIVGGNKYMEINNLLKGNCLRFLNSKIKIETNKISVPKSITGHLKNKINLTSIQDHIMKEIEAFAHENNAGINVIYRDYWRIVSLNEEFIRDNVNSLRNNFEIVKNHKPGSFEQRYWNIRSELYKHNILWDKVKINDIQTFYDLIDLLNKFFDSENLTLIDWGLDLLFFLLRIKCLIVDLKNILYNKLIEIYESRKYINARLIDVLKILNYFPYSTIPEIIKLFNNPNQVNLKISKILIEDLHSNRPNLNHSEIEKYIDEISRITVLIDPKKIKEVKNQADDLIRILQNR